MKRNQKCQVCGQKNLANANAHIVRHAKEEKFWHNKGQHLAYWHKYAIKITARKWILPPLKG